jgi:TetR/AcrR family transcriptional regulator, cholesterol catabolism regulator
MAKKLSRVQHIPPAEERLPASRRLNSSFAGPGTTTFLTGRNNMKTRQEDTEQRIINTALTIFFDQGIKRTSMDDIAIEAGLTRVTVYRYFVDKKELVRVVFTRIIEIIQSTFSDPRGSPDGIEHSLDCILQSFSSLPKGNLIERVNELRRVYPDLWEEFNAAYTDAVKTLFDQVFFSAQQQGILRPGVNINILQTYFSTVVLDMVQNPSLARYNLSHDEMNESIKMLFLHGILTH